MHLKTLQFKALGLCCAAVFLAACSSSPSAPGNGKTSSGGTGVPYAAPPMALSVYHEESATGDKGVLIDTSSLNDGYVAVSATNDAALKFQVTKGEASYTYDLPNDATPTCFVLQSGSGEYNFHVLSNVSGNKYASVYECTGSASLTTEFSPFVRPSQYVHYDGQSQCVAKANELVTGAETDVDVMAAVYEYVVKNITYDDDKAAAIAAGTTTTYLPSPDRTLAEGKGICFDYAALVAAMLRSQGIPTKLITGYVSPDNIYHAWNEVWLENSGWITVKIEAPAKNWQQVDLTFAAGGAKTFDEFVYTNRFIY